MNEGEAIQSLGWTQGAIFGAPAVETHSSLTDGQEYVVVSHPCDVVSASVERDPSVEVMTADRLDSVDGNYTHGKNPRALHLTRPEGAIGFRRDTKVVLDRRVLLQFPPAEVLTEDDRRVLARWLAASYARPAFANEFNRRVAPARRAIERLLKSAGADMSGIYVATQLDELSEADNYDVSMAITMRVEDFARPESFAVVSEAGDGLQSLLRDIDGINLNDLNVISERDVTLEDLRNFARWDYDSLTLRAEVTTTLPPAD